MEDGSWTPIGAAKIGNGSALEFTTPFDPEMGRMFYRIEVWRE